MPAVTVEDILVLPRLGADLDARSVARAGSAICH